MSRAAAGTRHRERGIALAAAVFALVVLAALLAGLWFAALQEYRVGANVVSDRRAFDAAEAGLDAALAGWNAGALNRLAVNDTAAFSGALGGGAASYAGVVRRLGPWLFLVRATGSDARSSSRRTLAAVARLSPLRLGVEAALVAVGRVRLGAGAFVDGLALDTGGSCAGAAPVAGVVVGDGALLDMSGCPARDCARGKPASMVDTALRDVPVPLLGESGWASLVAAAETIGPSGLAPSGSHVWFAPGDLSLPAGALAGPVVLLVQGELVVESGAQLTGLVVVRGRLIVRGAGGSFLGSVLAGEAELSALGGSQATVLHSHCAVEQALAAAAPARRLRERSWTALYPDAP
jgi:hypothetical protein